MVYIELVYYLTRQFFQSMYTCVLMWDGSCLNIQDISSFGVYFRKHCLFFAYPHKEKMCILSTVFRYMIETMEPITNNGMLYMYLIPKTSCM